MTRAVNLAGGIYSGLVIDDGSRSVNVSGGALLVQTGGTPPPAGGATAGVALSITIGMMTSGMQFAAAMIVAAAMLKANP